MKTSFVLNAFWIAVMSACLSFTAPVFGESSSGGSSSSNSIGLLNQADNLLHQAWAPEGTPPSDDQRTQLLTQARKLIRQVPPDQALFQGHKKKALLDIKAALREIKKDDPDNKVVTDHIRAADAELRTAISLGRVAATAP